MLSINLKRLVARAAVILVLGFSGHGAWAGVFIRLDGPAQQSDRARCVEKLVNEQVWPKIRESESGAQAKNLNVDDWKVDPGFSDMHLTWFSHLSFNSPPKDPQHTPPQEVWHPSGPQPLTLQKSLTERQAFDYQESLVRAQQSGLGQGLATYARTLWPEPRVDFAVRLLSAYELFEQLKNDRLPTRFKKTHVTSDHLQHYDLIDQMLWDPARHYYLLNWIAHEPGQYAEPFVVLANLWGLQARHHEFDSQGRPVYDNTYYLEVAVRLFHVRRAVNAHQHHDWKQRGVSGLYCELDQGLDEKITRDS